MFHRFLALETEPKLRSPLYTELLFDADIVSLRNSMQALFDRAPGSGWESTYASWLPNEYHFYNAYQSPPYQNRSGDFTGSITICRHLRDDKDYILAYKIFNAANETVESRGLRISEDGPQTIDYLRKPVTLIPVFRDQKGRDVFEDWRKMIINAEGVLTVGPPARGKE